MTLYRRYKDDIKKYKIKNIICCRSSKKVLEDICIIDINNDSRNFLSIDKKHWTEKIIIYALSRNGNYLAYIDKDIQTLDMALMAILTTKEKNILRYVNRKYIDKIYKRMAEPKYRCLGKLRFDDVPMSNRKRFYFLKQKIFIKYCYDVKKSY